MTATYVVRHATTDELPLIMSSWLKSLRHDQELEGDDIGPCRCIRCHTKPSRESYFRGQRKQIEDCFLTAEFWCATMPDVPGEVLGWACLEPGRLHYAYTKAAYRGAHVCLALLMAAGLAPGTFEVTHLTASVLRWIREGKPVRWNPYVLG